MSIVAAFRTSCIYACVILYVSHARVTGTQALARTSPGQVEIAVRHRFWQAPITSQTPIKINKNKTKIRPAPVRRVYTNSDTTRGISMKQTSSHASKRCKLPKRMVVCVPDPFFCFVFMLIFSFVAARSGADGCPSEKLGGRKEHRQLGTDESRVAQML